MSGDLLPLRICLHCLVRLGNVKGKVIPVQAVEALEG
jgi:hypothetical protein